MSDKTWKAVERRVAEFWGTERTPLSGGNSRHGTHSDTLHPRVYIEMKHGGGCPTGWPGIVSLFQETEEKAALEKKRAVLILHRKGQSRVGQYDTYLRIPVYVTGREACRTDREVVCVPQEMARRIVLGEDPKTEAGKG